MSDGASEKLPSTSAVPSAVATLERDAAELSAPESPWDHGKAREVIRGLLTLVHKQRAIIELSKISSNEFNLLKLLEIIVHKSSEVVDADRSTLFLVDHREKRLWTVVAEGMSAGTEHILTLPLGAGIVGHVAGTATQLIINDAYSDPRFDRSVDSRTGYHTRNLVATPLVSNSGVVLGVLEVMNRTGGPFLSEDADLLQAFASEAASHVETAQLYGEIEGLFDSFLATIAHAVDERDPCTAGHSRRVRAYSRAIGEEINLIDSGPLADVKFSEDQLRQLEMAALLHDVGKIGVRESVLNKRNRLTDEALQIICQRLDLELSHHKVDLLQAQRPLDPGEDQVVHDAIEFIRRVSVAGMLTADEGRRLWEIRERGWLDDCEYEHLAVSRGNLTAEEWEHMQSHVTKSFQILGRIAWPDKYQRVPEIAYCHHEKLNGKGYPRGLGSDQIPLEAQIVTVADIYDALTAHDRPYKPPMSHEKAAKILRDQATDGFLNDHVVEVFFGRELHILLCNKGT